MRGPGTLLIHSAGEVGFVLVDTLLFGIEVELRLPTWLGNQYYRHLRLCSSFRRHQQQLIGSMVNGFQLLTDFLKAIRAHLPCLAAEQGMWFKSTILVLPEVYRITLGIAYNIQRSSRFAVVPLKAPAFARN